MLKRLLMFRYSIIFLITILFACGNADNKKQTENSANESSIQSNTQRDLAEGNFYKRLEGKIAGQEVVAHFSKFEDKMFFNYYYVSQGVPIGLYANVENKLASDSIELIEWDMQSKRLDNKGDNKWRIVISENSVSGIWIGRDGKKVSTINLKENYPSGSYLYNIIGKSASHPVKFKNDTVTARSYIMMMEPSDATSSKWFAEKIIENIWGDEANPSSSIMSVIESQTKQFFEEYEADMDTLRKSIDNADTGRHHTLNYENDINANALYNDNGFLVLDVGSYNYYGGAHGMQGSSILCYDMKEKRALNLSDVISIDSIALQKIVEKNFRKASRIPANKPLTEILFENKLPANDNFYFTNKGLGFVYQPYEVAAYVYSMVNVFIPYAEVMPNLNPQFAQRMNLE